MLIQKISVCVITSRNNKINGLSEFIIHNFEQVTLWPLGGTTCESPNPIGYLPAISTFIITLSTNIKRLLIPIWRAQNTFRETDIRCHIQHPYQTLSYTTFHSNTATSFHKIPLLVLWRFPLPCQSSNWRTAVFGF